MDRPFSLVLKFSKSNLSGIKQVVWSRRQDDFTAQDIGNAANLEFWMGAGLPAAFSFWRFKELNIKKFLRMSNSLDGLSKGRCWT
jgi:hypothetical protein